MIKRHEKVRQVVQKDLICSSGYCDGCGKRLFTTFHKPNSYNIYERVDVYKITTGHHDWGNDSIDSIEEKLFCKDCFMKEVDKYKQQTIGRNNTRYIEIEHNLENDYGEYEEVEENA